MSISCDPAENHHSPYLATVITPVLSQPLPLGNGRGWEVRYAGSPYSRGPLPHRSSEGRDRDIRPKGSSLTSDKLAQYTATSTIIGSVD